MAHFVSEFDAVNFASDLATKIARATSDSDEQLESVTALSDFVAELDYRYWDSPDPLAIELREAAIVGVVARNLTSESNYDSTRCMQQVIRIANSPNLTEEQKTPALRLLSILSHSESFLSHWHDFQFESVLKWMTKEEPSRFRLYATRLAAAVVLNSDYAEVAVRESLVATLIPRLWELCSELHESVQTAYALWLSTAPPPSASSSETATATATATEGAGTGAEAGSDVAGPAEPPTTTTATTTTTTTTTTAAAATTASVPGPSNVGESESSSGQDGDVEMTDAGQGASVATTTATTPDTAMGEAGSSEARVGGGGGGRSGGGGTDASASASTSTSASASASANMGTGAGGAEGDGINHNTNEEQNQNPPAMRASPVSEEVVYLVCFLHAVVTYQESFSPFVAAGGAELVLALVSVPSNENGALPPLASLELCHSALVHRKFLHTFITEANGLSLLADFPRVDKYLGGVAMCFSVIVTSYDIVDALVPKLDESVIAGVVDYTLFLTGELLKTTPSGASALAYCGPKYALNVVIGAHRYLRFVQEFAAQKALPRLFHVLIEVCPGVNLDVTVERNTLGSLCSAVVEVLRSYVSTYSLAVFPDVVKASVKYGGICHRGVLSDSIAIDDLCCCALATRAARSNARLLRDSLALFLQPQARRVLFDLLFLASDRCRAPLAACAVTQILCYAALFPENHHAIIQGVDPESGSIEGMRTIVDIALPYTGVQKYHRDQRARVTCLRLLQYLLGEVGVTTFAVVMGVNKEWQRVSSKAPPAVFVVRAFRRCNGLHRLLEVIGETQPLATIDEIRTHALRVLCGLAADKDSASLLARMAICDKIAELAREPVVGNFVDTQMFFCLAAVRLLSLVSGRTIRAKFAGKGAILPTQASLLKRDVTEAPQVDYREDELLQLISHHLATAGLTRAAAAVLEDAKLPALGAAPDVLLDDIVRGHLRSEHRSCQKPSSILPRFSVLEHHQCPVPPSKAPPKIFSQLFRRQIVPRAGGRRGKSVFSHFVYSRYKETVTLIAPEPSDPMCFAFASEVYPWDRVLTGSDDGCVTQFYRPSGEPMDIWEPLQVNDGVFNLSVSPNSPGLAISTGSCVALYNRQTQAIDWESPHSLCGYYSRTGDRVLLTSLDFERGRTSCAQIADAETGAITCTMKVDSRPGVYDGNTAKFGPLDELVLNDGVLWDCRVPTAIHEFDRLSSYARGYFHPHGQSVILGEYIWDMRTFKLLRCMKDLAKSHLAFNGTGDIMLSCQRMNTGFISVYDSHTYELVSSVDFDESVRQMTFSPDGSQLGLLLHENGSGKATVKLIDVGLVPTDADGEDLDRDDDGGMGGNRTFADLGGDLGGLFGNFAVGGGGGGGGDDDDSIADPDIEMEDQAFEDLMFENVPDLMQMIMGQRGGDFLQIDDGGPDIDDDDDGDVGPDIDDDDVDDDGDVIIN